MSPLTYTLKELTLSEPKAESILSQTIYTDDTIKVALFSFAAGQTLSQHTASKPVILQVLQGEAELGLGDDKHEVSAGTWLHMSAHLPHSVTAKTTLHFLLTLLK